MRKIVSVCLMLFFSCSVAIAAPFFWIGGTGDWDNPQNWNQGQLPGVGDEVIIPSGGNNVTIPQGYTAKVGTVELRTNATLTISGELSLKTTGTYALWCKGKLKLTIDAYLEASGDTYNTKGIWIDNGSFSANKESEIWLSDLENGMVVEGGYFSNAGEVHIQYTRPSFSGILAENQGLVYNWSSGKIFVKNMDGPGITLYANSSRFYNYGLIMSTGNHDSYTFNTFGGARFYNQKSGEIIIKSSGNISIYNSGEIYNKGKMEILSGGKFQNWVGTFYNQSSGTLLIDHPSAADDAGLTLSGLNSPSYLENDGLITIKNVGLTMIPLYINEDSEFINNATGTVQITHTLGDQGVYINEGSFQNNGGSLSIKINGSGTALKVKSGYSFTNAACGELIIESGDLDVEGTLTNDAWMYLEEDETDISISGVFDNEGLIVDPHLLLTGQSGFNNQGIVFDRLDPAPVYPGPFIQNALSIGDFDEVSFISWHLSENGPQAGTFLSSSNQVSLFNSSIGLKSLWLNFDFNLGNCGNVWLELPVQGGVQAPPPPPAQQNNGNWNIHPNPARDQLEITMGVESGQVVQIQLLNELGQTVFEFQEYGEKGSNLTIARPSNLVPGWYMLRIIGEDDMLFSGKVIWQ